MKTSFSLTTFCTLLKVSLMMIGIVIITKPCHAQQLLIKPSRTISFETSEGSYMDVDLSPDGTKIVFDLLGDLYVLPSEGGKATQLTKGLAWNRYPVWSPDGKQIACKSDISGANHVNVMSADGSVQRTLMATEPQIGQAFIDDMPVWSPDGNYIAEHNQLDHIDGGKITLPSNGGRVIQFSVNGQYIFYCKNNMVGKYDSGLGTTKEISNLPEYASNVRISPNEQWLTYVTKPALKSGLVIRDLNSGKDRVLIPIIETHYRKMQEHYTFTSDSKYLLIGYNGKIHKINVENGVDQIIPFIAHVNAGLGPLNYNSYKLAHDSFQVRYTRSANLSPDGHTVVFSAMNRVYTMATPNGKPHIVAEQPCGQYQPIFSPDGKWIAYVTKNDLQGGTVWRVPTSGGKPEKLTNCISQAVYSHPVWSPDGKRLAFISYTDVGNDAIGNVGPGSLGKLQTLLIKDKSIHDVKDSIPVENNLSFSSDGSRLICFFQNFYNPGLKAGLMSYDLDGKNVSKLADYTNFSAMSVKPDIAGIRTEISISPDNRYIAYQINEKIYLSSLPGIAAAMQINYKTGNVPIFRISENGIDIHWENGGKMLCWSFANHFYRINPDRVMLAAVQLAKDTTRAGKYDDGIYDLNITLDETITINIKAPRQYAHGILALRNARILSMKGVEVIENGTIIISDGRFISVGPAGSVRIPAGAKIFDLKGKTIIPGFIDLHDHFHTGQEIFEQQAWSYLSNLAYGVTTSRDPQTDYSSFGHAELLETGQMTGPRLFSVGDAVIHPIVSLDDARSIVRNRAALGAIAVKQYLQPTRLQKQWLLIACHEMGLNMTNEGDYDPQGYLAMMKDGSTGVEHVPVWGNVFNDVIQFIAKAGTWNTPTLQVLKAGEDGKDYFRFFNKHPDSKLSRFWPKDFYDGLLKSTNIPRDTINPEFQYVSNVETAIRKQGGHVALGSHGNNAGIGSHWEIWALQMGGLTNMEALQAATIEGARGLGLQNDLGTIEAGKIADLIILDKNPLGDIHNTMSIRWVMKDGILYDGDTLNAIWPFEKKLPEWRYQPKQTKDTKK